jgi:hypothetical protein
MIISKVDFGSLLTYSPRGTSIPERNSKDITIRLKNDQYITKEDPPILMSDFISKLISKNKNVLPFSNFFNNNTTLIPIPNSSLMELPIPNSPLPNPKPLWVPQRFAKSLVYQGLGKEVLECLRRVKPLPKSAISTAPNRPKAFQHYDSLEVTEKLPPLKEILLVDDVITRGATIIGATNKLKDIYPNTVIRAFAVIRTISSSLNFNKIYDPCIGQIELNDSGETFRNP